MGFSPAGGNISGADDVALSGPVNNQVLTYDTSVQKWRNATAPTVTAPTVLVASADASNTIKAQADFVCDGTADQVQINSAIDIAAALTSRSTASPVGAQQRGHVILSGGRFNCNDAIVMRTAVRLSGQGWLSEIRAVSCNATGLIRLASVNEHLCQIDRLYLYGNYSAGGSCDAINFDMTGSTNAGVGTYPSSSPDSYHHLTDLFIDGFTSTAGRNGIKIWCSASANNRGNMIDRIQMRNIDNHGIWLSSASDSYISNTHIGTCGGSGYYIETSNTKMTNNKAFYCDGAEGGLYLNSDHATVSVFEAQECHTGIRIDGSDTALSAIKADICRDDGIFVNRSRTTISGFAVSWKTGMRYGSTPTTNGIRFASGLSDLNIMGHVASTASVTNRVVGTPGGGSFMRVSGGGTLVSVGA